MTFMEYQDKLKSKVRTPLAIFGTDISESALQKARAAIYPDSITSEISSERLKKFFEKVPSGGYRIAKWLREMCLFSKHDVTRDPPFGKVDMISCRNVLIYFDLSLHKFVFPIFHYSLNPGGILLLGKSESVGGFSTLFSVADKTTKAYFKKNIKAPLRVKFPTGPYSVENLPAAKNRTQLVPSRFDLQHESERLALLEYAPPSVLVNNALEIVQSRGRTAPYLELAPGQPSLNLFKMAHPELIADLRAAVTAAKKQNATVTKSGLRFRDSGKMKSLSLKVIPILASANSKERYFNIFFEEAKDQAVPLKSSKKNKHHQELQQKLVDNEEYQQSLVEEYETAQEELVASNEELQSTNEELQSTNEELETAKEELQSANEELTTINDELQNRNSDMVGLNNDLVNFLGSVDIPIVMVGSDGRIRRFTPKAAKALKLIASDVGRLIGDIKPNIKVPDLDVLVAEVMEDMTTKEIETQDNLGRWFQLQVRPYRTTENKIDGAVISLIDIDSLKRSRDDANSIIESQPVPILVVDGHYRVKLANDIFYQKFHVSKIETEGMKVTDLGSGQWKIPQLQKLLELTLVNDETFEHFQVEYDFPNIGKKIMFLSSRRFHLAGSGETAALLVIEDVTEQMQMQKDRLDFFLKEQKANRIKDEFLAILSHELRTPLTTILAWSQMLLKGTLDAEKTKRAIEVVEQSAKAQGQLIDDLLDISRIQAGKLHLSIQEIDPAKVLSNAIESTRILANKKSIQVESLVDPSLTSIFADPIRLQQILWNLITNSIKFSSTGGKIWVAIEKTIVDKDDWVRIQVKDNGKGMKSEFLPQLFERFTQVDSSSTRAYGGLGLGLAIVKKLVQMHGGSVQAESPGDDQGSTFTVLIPAKKMISDRIISNQSESYEVDERCLEGVKILVVEDDPNSREVFTIMLLSFGAIVKSAGSASEGLELFNDFRPDVLVSDIAMPGEDGYSFMTKIRAQNSKIPAIALTAHATQKDVELALKAGYNAHLAKPVGANKLAFSVSRIVEQG
jgi:two-component system CheB/CheR fusion protein